MAFLDTSFVIDLLRESENQTAGPATQKLASLRTSPVRLSIFVCCELEAGLARVRDGVHERKRLEALYEMIEIVTPNGLFPKLYGETLARMAQKGTPVPLMDLLIATTVKQSADVLITRNLRDFEKIPGLTVIGY